MALGSRQRLAMLAGAVVLATLSVTAANAAPSSYVQFRTPSGNIGCGYDSGSATLRCDIGTGLQPRPPKPKNCPLDWGFGYFVKRTGTARVVCAGDTAIDRRSPAVPYGTTWRRGGFACISTRAGLRCTNSSGHGFFLSKQSSNRF